MPWTPILASLEGDRLAQSNMPAGRLAGDREQLIGLINACQQCLGELLRRLHAEGEPGGDADAARVRVTQVVAETLGRLGELAPGQPAATVRPEELDAMRAATEQLSARLTILDGAIEERMLRTADLAARGAEIAMQDRLRALRSEIESVRKAAAEASQGAWSLRDREDAVRGGELGTLRTAIEGACGDLARLDAAVADVRSTLGRHDAARGSELGALRAAVEALRADLGRLDAALDARILSRVDSAWRALDAELTRLRARVEGVVASVSGGWSCGKLVRDGIGAVGAAAELVLGRLGR